MYVDYTSSCLKCVTCVCSTGGVSAVPETPTESKTAPFIHVKLYGKLIPMRLTLFSHWTVNPGLFLDTPTPNAMNHAPAFPACELTYPLDHHFETGSKN